MRIRSTATRLGALVGAAALLSGLAVGAGVAVHAQGTPTATTAAPAATPSGPTPASNIGGPASVPSARFFGSVSGAGGQTLAQGTTVTASVGGVACGFGTVNAGQYVVDVQAISGCTAPGANVAFTVGGNPATNTGSLPPIEGTAVQLNLTAGAAATPTPPPPPPTPARTATAAPTPPPPPPPSTPAATPRPATPAAQQGISQKPSAVTSQKPAAAGGAQRPRPAAAGGQRPVAYGAGGAAPRLPNTGTGGLLGQSSSSTTSFALFGIVLGALALSATGLVAYRRSR